jgi:hypothetical protein
MDQSRSVVDGPEAAGGAEAFLPVQAFLSLFLVLLAFFIVLASVSQPEAGRVVKAITSVRASFPSDLPLGSSTGETTSLFVEADRSLPERVGRLVEADLPVAPVRRDPSTGQIAAEAPLAALFEDARLSVPGQAFIRRVASFLAAPPEGTLLVVTALVPNGDSLSAERATRIARSLVEEGAPAPTVTVGLERNPAGSVRFLFGLRPAGVAW